MLKLGALINAKTLADSLKLFPNKLKVLDATWYLPNFGRTGIDNYKNGHIPGAMFFDIDACSMKSQYEHMLPTESQFSDYVGNLGIDNNTHVVVYNDHPQFALFSAPRVWWMFRIFGHNSVSVLDGGIRSWRDAKYEVASGEERSEKKQFQAKLVSPTSIKSFEEVLANISDQQFQLIDARSAGRFHGTDPEPRQDTKPGHIPGASSMPFTSVLGPYTCPDGEVIPYGVVKNPDEIKNAFDQVGVDLDKPLTASCGSGVSACCLVFAAHLCGKHDTCVYDGAWVEWFKRSTKDQRVNCPE